MHFIFSWMSSFQDNRESLGINAKFFNIKNSLLISINPKKGIVQTIQTTFAGIIRYVKKDQFIAHDDQNSFTLSSNS